MLKISVLTISRSDYLRFRQGRYLEHLYSVFQSQPFFYQASVRSPHRVTAEI